MIEVTHFITENGVEKDDGGWTIPMPGPRMPVERPQCILDDDDDDDDDAPIPHVGNNNNCHGETGDTTTSALY